MPKFLNTLFIIHILIVCLVIIGFLPRLVVPYLAIALVIYILIASLEDSTTFFVRSIPFFIAIPITANFDSLNMWRIFSGIIFLKWAWKNDWHGSEFWHNLKKRRVAVLLLLLLLFAFLSVTQAQSHTLAIKRIVYFINLSLIGIVIYDLARKNQDFSRRLMKNIAIPTILVAVIGMAQLISTYYMDIFQFVDLWAGKVELNLFGSAWAATALKSNNWFAYFGDQLSLRMFSVFPDSHSFPLFLLLGLPAVFALSLRRVIDKNLNSLRAMLQTRSSVLVIFVPIILLAAILSGTRGIWAASVGVVIVSIWLIYRNRKTNLDLSHRNVFKYVSSYLAIFFLLFGFAYYIFASNQFEVSKEDSALFGKRVRSLIDISETSNARRIEIWKDSLRSIIKHPLLGVGIGNFPVVVGEDLARAKAGSSAHNLYLNIAAEMGIPALIIALWFLWLLMQKIYSNFIAAKDSLGLIYYASALLSMAWVLFYSLTDAVLFDERVFLLFAATVALIGSDK